MINKALPSLGWVAISAQKKALYEKMSKIFCCGQSGCDIIVMDDAAQAYAQEQMEKWESVWKK